MIGRKNKVKFHAQKVCFHFIMLPKFPKYSTTAKQTIKHHCISEVVGAGFACASVTQTSSRQLNFGNNFGDQHARCKQPQPSNGRAQRLEDGKEFCWSLKAETSTQTNIIQSTCRTSKQRKSPFNTWVFRYPRL